MRRVFGIVTVLAFVVLSVGCSADAELGDAEDSEAAVPEESGQGTPPVLHGSWRVVEAAGFSSGFLEIEDQPILVIEESGFRYDAASCTDPGIKPVTNWDADSFFVDSSDDIPMIECGEYLNDYFGILFFSDGDRGYSLEDDILNIDHEPRGWIVTLERISPN